MVDDKPVYVGETPRSLGYLTFKFPPVTGRSLKIELTGRPKDVDAFGQIVEVTGQKDTGAAGDETGKISIIETEIYEEIDLPTCQRYLSLAIPLPTTMQTAARAGPIHSSIILTRRKSTCSIAHARDAVVAPSLPKGFGTRFSAR